MFRRKENDVSKRFKMGNCIGAGAFASIYSATDLTTKQKVAVKKIGKSKKTGQLPMEEYTISKDLKHHNVIRTLDCVVTETHMFLSVELYNGGDLFAQLDPSGAGLDEKLARRYMAQLADGLAYVHEQGVVHADVKPENVLLHNGVVKVCDFGLAARAGSTRTGSSKGTGAYMAPELVNRPDPTVPYAIETSQDVWSYGVVMYAVLFADLPWEKARPSDPDFNLFCSLGGVSSRLHPFQHVSSPMRRFMNMVFSFNPKKRPTMRQCAEFLKSSVQWYSTSSVRRTSISFGMRENKDFRKGAAGGTDDDSGMEDGDSTSSVSLSSLPSMHGHDDVDAQMSAAIREVAL